jgi:hypothetical protein
MQEILNHPNSALAVLVITVYILGELLKHRSFKKNGLSNSNFNAQDRQKLNELAKAHDAKDINGTPLWYMPRTKLDEIINELKKINENFDKWECPYSGE